jgi:hypothetical protein
VFKRNLGSLPNYIKNSLKTATLVFAVSEACSPPLMLCMICTILTAMMLALGSLPFKVYNPVLFQLLLKPNASGCRCGIHLQHALRSF